MPLIEHREFILAPIEVCFDLARDVDVHTQTAAYTEERVVDGVLTGLMEAGETVTWEAVHLGVKQKLTAKVTMMNRPYRFEDIMVKGAFHSFKHIHEFIKQENGTVMIDYFQYKSPFGLLGIIADKLFLEKYMKEFIVKRAQVLKQIAESY